jgi:hypothetical protein
MSHTPDLPTEFYHERVVQFLAELMVATQEKPTQDVFQHAIQAYCDSLRPSLEPGDCSTPARAVFPLLEGYTCNEDTDQIAVRLSPEGYTFFRAWLRRQSELVRAGAYPQKEWSN